MAVDDVLFQSVAHEEATWLRFYSWEKPTVSLGYSQQADVVLNLESCREQGIEVVRRITGGKMVLHHREVTYSLCSADSDTFTYSLSESYHRISQGLLMGLRNLGLEAGLAARTPSFYSRGNLPCFSHPARDEIEVAGKKLVGSAQKRKGNRFLQHGSILLEEHVELLQRISPAGADSGELNMTSLLSCLGRKLTFDDVVEKLTQGFADYFRIRLETYSWEDIDLDAVRKLQRERYRDLAGIP